MSLATTNLVGVAVCNRMDYMPTDKEMNEFLELAMFSPVLAIDTETTGYEIRDGRGHAMGLSIAYKLAPTVVRSAYFPFRHKNGSNYDLVLLDRVKTLIERHPALVFHNAKFDLVSLATLGIRPTGRFYDTMLMAHMIDENIMSKALDYLARYYLKDSGKEKIEALELFIKTQGWENVPILLMYAYACKDAELTLLLYDMFDAGFRDQGYYENDLWDVEQEFVRLLIRMEGRGVEIDTALSEQQYDIGIARMAELAKSLGANPSSPKDLAKLLIDDLGLPVFKHTPGGKPSFDKTAMAKYEEALKNILGGKSVIAESILEYRGWQKTTSSNYKAYLDLLSPDGRLRPNYKIHGTVTGRLSCEKPNLQQIPRSSDNPWNGHLKSAFVAQPGYTLYEADYSQLELRLASAYANEKSLIDAFATGRDVFSEMAEELGMPRHDVKTLTYTIQYGGGINRLTEVFRMSEEEAREVRENFYAKYPGFRKMSNIASVKARKNGYLKLWTGRRRHFANPAEESHKAFNSVIQGGAAEIMKRTMIRMGKEVDSENCRMLLQVHDSIVFEVKDTERDKILPEIKRVMESVEPDFGVHFACDVHEWGKAS